MNQTVASGENPEHWEPIHPTARLWEQTGNNDWEHWEQALI